MSARLYSSSGGILTSLVDNGQLEAIEILAVGIARWPSKLQISSQAIAGGCDV